MRIAVCLFGNLQPDADLALINTKLNCTNLQNHAVTVFQSFASCSENEQVFKSLYLCAMKKRSYEMLVHSEFDLCLAVDVNKIDFLSALSIPDKIEKETVYAVSGSFSERFYVTGINLDIFFARSLDFDRACELYLHLPKLDYEKMRGYGQMDFTSAHIFYYHLKSLYFKTKCTNYENRNLFKRTA